MSILTDKRVIKTSENINSVMQIILLIVPAIVLAISIRLSWEKATVLGPNLQHYFNSNLSVIGIFVCELLATLFMMMYSVMRSITIEEKAEIAANQTANSWFGRFVNWSDRMIHHHKYFIGSSLIYVGIMYFDYMVFIGHQEHLLSIPGAYLTYGKELYFDNIILFYFPELTSPNQLTVAMLYNTEAGEMAMIEIRKAFMAIHWATFKLQCGLTFMMLVTDHLSGTTSISNVQLKKVLLQMNGYKIDDDGRIVRRSVNQPQPQPQPRPQPQPTNNNDNEENNDDDEVELPEDLENLS